ncbi:hypothetical protein [Marinobacterium jannaschii]|uniref:hypothetical protein n=1 Tax=Marinobacterium jannaschii TaxID=64970 RepID=UPI0004856394|nr:hypothetical protein [Marinobacterium jannaschii]
MNISLSTLLPGVAPAQIHSHSATRAEVQELVAEGLVGKQTSGMNVMSVDSMDIFQVTQWSEQTNSQWWGLIGEGDIGAEAAGYLEQMTAERRGHASQYLDDYFSLSNKMANMLQDEYPRSADLDQLLDNVAEGRKPSENADGSVLPKAEVLDAFWSQHESEINQMLDSYEALKASPTHLSEWLDQKQIERSPELDRIVEKHRYSGLNGNFEASEGLVSSAQTILSRHGDGTVGDSGKGLNVFNDTVDTALYNRYDSKAASDLMQRSIEISLRMGDAAGMKYAVGSEMMHNERSAMLASYQTLYQPLSDSFYGRLGDLEPNYSLQDMLDNLAAGNDPAQMDDGSLHPDAEKIQTFASQFANNLEAVGQKQQQLDDLPKTRQEWLAIDSNARKAEQVVFEQYGLEPWEQGMNARIHREGIWTGLDYYQSQGPEAKQEIMNQAVQRAERLEKLVRQALSGYESQGLDLQTVVDNFRFNRPPGLTAEGDIHPRNGALEGLLKAHEEDVIKYIDSAWLIGEQDNLAMVDYNDWMTSERASEYAGDLVAMIQQSRAAIDLDSLVGQQQDSLLAMGNGQEESNA